MKHCGSGDLSDKTNHLASEIDFLFRPNIPENIIKFQSWFLPDILPRRQIKDHLGTTTYDYCPPVDPKASYKTEFF
jgi:uncharacterized membrane protein YheB (UPF0754 family)